MPQIQVFTPTDVNSQTNPASISSYNLQLLAQGDSWFSIGQLGLPPTSNLFDGMSTTIQACAVNCARPGAVLEHMTDKVSEEFFLAMLKSQQWGGILLSGGGNDMIDAVQAGPNNPPEKRLLATQAEWTNAVGGDKYLSNAGWATFSDHLVAVISGFLQTRDVNSNKGVPVIMHSYDDAVPRPAGAGIAGPWLSPAMGAFGIPQGDWPAVAIALMQRLQTLLDHIAATTPDGSLHIVHTQGTLIPALTTDPGATVDWVNEIHPSVNGYRKLSALWQPVLDQVLSGMAPPAATAAVVLKPTPTAPTMGELLQTPSEPALRMPGAAPAKPGDGPQAASH